MREAFRMSFVGTILFTIIFVSVNILAPVKVYAAAPSNDDKVNAYILPNSDNWVSTAAQFSTFLATPDQSKGSCASNGPNYNVWFTFIANTSSATIQLRSGGVDGTLQYPFLSIWDSVGAQIGCAIYATATGTLELSVINLMIGQQYYISVDNYNSISYRGTFTFSFINTPSYDFVEGAILIPSTSNWSSANAAYSTIDATADNFKGSCWNTGPNYNRWFTFTANTNFLNFQVKSGGVLGSLQYPYVALWDSSMNQIACALYTTATGTLELSVDSLIPGKTYYVSVDNYSEVSYRGSFSIYVDDQPNYNWMQGALVLPSTSNWSSANAAYSTIDATPDQAKGNCWNTGPNYNRWFTFTANTEYISFQVKNGGAFGNLQYPYIALWDSSMNQLACALYTTASGTLELSANALIPGRKYYVSVDNYSAASYRGSFSIYVDDQPNYNWMEGALVLPSTSNWSSANAAYSTIDATPDQAKGSCWNTGPNYNRWFTFTASTEYITFLVKNGGVFGNLQYPYIALWDSSLNQLACALYTTASGTLELSANALIPGRKYYISIDNYAAPTYRGSFSIYIDDQPNYNWMEGAVVLPSTNNWSSANAAYSTIDATPDQAKGNCWNAGPNFNRWFTFTANTEYITFLVKNGGVFGNLQYPYIALWDSSLNQLACASYTTASGTLELSVNALNPGKKYYVSVDNHSAASYRGSFSLYVDDQPNYNWMEGALVIPSTSNWSSANAAYTTVDATADRGKGSCWNNGPNYNRWFTFTATTPYLVAQVKNGGAFGNLQYPFIALWDSSLTQIACAIYTTASGTLELSSVSLQPGAKYYLTVDNYFASNYRGTFSLYVDNQPSYNFKEGAILIPSTQNWSSANAAYTTIDATGDQAKGSCWTNGPNYNRWFKFVATSAWINLQVKSGGSFGNLQYPFIAIWDSSLNELGCAKYVTATGTLDYCKGGLVVGGTYFVSVDNYVAASYRGSFSLYANDQPTYDFLEGAIQLTQLSNWTSPPAAYSNVFATQDRSKGTCAANGPNNNVWFKFFAPTSYININLISGSSWGSLSYAYITLYNSTLGQLACVPYSAAQGTLALTANSLTVGQLYYVSVDNFVGYSGTFTLYMSSYNPLPIDLSSFSAKRIGKKVEINWQTMTEINNDFCTVERSADGINFESIKVVSGAGNSTSIQNYMVLDETPLPVRSYYRLRQTDYDGHFEVFDPVSVDPLVNASPFVLYSVGLNSTNDCLRLDFSSAKSGQMLIQVYGSSGNLVKHEMIKVNQGTGTFFVKEINELNNGVYFINLNDGSTQTEALKFAKQ